MTKAIGLFGGTFDPVHNGHLRSAVEIIEKFQLDHLCLIPNAVPPHREQPQASAEQRLLMLQLAVKNSTNIIVDDCELKREGPSYSIDTVKLFRQRYTDSPLYLIIGTDAFQYIDTWYQWQQLLDYCHIIVMARPEQPLSLTGEVAQWYQQHHRLLTEHSDNDSLAGSIWPITLTQLAISATSIRQQISEGKSPAFLLPDPVMTVISQLGFYR